MGLLRSYPNGYSVGFSNSGESDGGCSGPKTKARRGSAISSRKGLGAMSTPLPICRGAQRKRPGRRGLETGSRDWLRRNGFGRVMTKTILPKND
jgi:hypothetical protein